MIIIFNEQNLLQHYKCPFKLNASLMNKVVTHFTIRLHFITSVNYISYELKMNNTSD